MQQKTIVLTVISIVVCVSVSYSQNTVEQIYQNAMYEEEIKGELRSAITMYETIIKDENSGRTIRAKAHLHIGQCYEKLGQKEAQKAYQTVINQYPDQAETVEAARNNLQRLMSFQSEESPEKKELKLRQVWEDCTGWSLALSPDNQSFVYTSNQRGNTALYDMNTGRIRWLTQDASYFREYGESNVWSPDGCQIACCWYTDSTASLRIFNADGSGFRTVHTALVSDSYLYPFAWSPDGKNIMTFYNIQMPGEKPNHIDRVAWIDLEKGSIEIIKSFGDHHINTYDLSPDGHYLAHDLRQLSVNKNRDIFLLSRDGDEQSMIAGNPADDWAPIWTPDGTQILFLSDRSGTIDLWSVDIHDGKRASTPEIIQKNVGEIIPIGISSEFTYYYIQSSAYMDIYTEEIDFSTGKSLSKPIKLTSEFKGTYSKPAWSPDGNQIAYLSYGKKNSPSYLSLIIKDMKNAKENLIAHGLLPTKLSPNAFRPRWSPDGNSILLRASVSDTVYGFYTVDVQSGRVKALIEKSVKELDLGFEPAYSPDGSKIFNIGSDLKTIQVLDLCSSEEKILVSGNAIQDFALSEDGNHLAYIDEVHGGYVLLIYTLNDGNKGELFRLPDNELYSDERSLLWIKQDQLLLGSYLHDDSGDRVARYRRIPISGEDPMDLELTPDINYFRHINIHPDKKRIASVRYKGGPQIWAMENFIQDEN
ncbi:hypothetical protein BVY01_02330 [bacterium I07]|nr:hypothetical protein BVY01_02330 [bacterium I07]